MKPPEKKWPQTKVAGHKPERPSAHALQLKPAVAQSKSAAPAAARPHPAAPPVYRPQANPPVAQRKSAAPAQAKPQPPAPPVYRPQPLPEVLQMKVVPGRQPPPAPTNERKPGAAPPASLPRPEPRVLQAKAPDPRHAHCVHRQGHPAGHAQFNRPPLARPHEPQSAQPFRPTPPGQPRGNYQARPPVVQTKRAAPFMPGFGLGVIQATLCWVYVNGSHVARALTKKERKDNKIKVAGGGAFECAAGAAVNHAERKAWAAVAAHAKGAKTIQFDVDQKVCMECQRWFVGTVLKGVGAKTKVTIELVQKGGRPYAPKRTVDLAAGMN